MHALLRSTHVLGVNIYGWTDLLHKYFVHKNDCFYWFIKAGASRNKILPAAIHD
jgi:hypothetical protein